MPYPTVVLSKVKVGAVKPLESNTSGIVVGTVAETCTFDFTVTSLAPVPPVTSVLPDVVPANAGAAHIPASIVAAHTPTTPFFKFEIFIIVPFLSCHYVAKCALRILFAEGPLAFDVQNNFSGRLAGLLVRLAIVAGERGHGGVLSGIKILRQLDRFEYAGRALWQPTRTPSRPNLSA